MAYETGSATDIRDLLNKLEVFAKTQGWHAFWEEKVLYCDKDGHYIAIAYNDSGVDDISSGNGTHYPLIQSYVLTGHENNKNVTQQPGAVANPAVTSGFYPPFVKYEFFASALYIHVVVEVNAGLFNHFGFGVHEKAFNYAGGAYAYGVDWAMYYSSTWSARNDAQYHAHKYPFGEGGTYVCYDGKVYGMLGGYFRKEGNRVLPTYIFDDTPNEMNGVAPLLPIINAVSTPPYTGTYILGRVPDMRAVKVNNLRPGDVVKLGQEEWVCYPIKRRALEAVPTDEIASGAYGLAYKKVL